MKSLNGNRSQNYGAQNAFLEPSKAGFTHQPIMKKCGKSMLECENQRGALLVICEFFKILVRKAHSSNARRQDKRTNATMMRCDNESVGCARRRGALFDKSILTLFDKSILNSQATARNNGEV